ncbi:MAG: hypothetical protein EBT34_13825 [Acetobacteraceae bacterium]|nr:hypothetical protein [Acetobacteraceae bacterium]
MAKVIYNAIVFTDDVKIGKQGYITYHKINDLIKFEKFISDKYPNWKFYTIYDNLTKEKIEVIKAKS